MIRLAAIVALGLAVAGCDLVNSMTDVFKNAQAVADDLESTTGLKPNVGANWKNGHLAQVTVTYPRLPEGKPMPELVEAVRTVIRKEFKQEPENIILSFVIPKVIPKPAAS
jgi:hypothetical protein